MQKIKGWMIAVVILVLTVLWGIGSYNGLVSLNANVESATGNIQVALQRRSDLIPNLVATVKGYATHEKDVIDSVTSARAKLAGAKNMGEQAAAVDELNTAISRLLVVVENYPTLKADANFRQLQDELAGTENRVAVTRKQYNDAVKVYNEKIKKFPTVIIANMAGFDKKAYFEASEEAQKAPKVEF